MVLLLAGTAAMAMTSTAFAAPRRAQDFVDSIGVNVHVMYTDGGYAKLENIESALRYLGIKSLRDHEPGADNARYGELARAGYSFDFITGGDPDKVIAQLESFAAQYPHAIDAVEGPNEVNNWPITYRGRGGAEGAMAYQAALYAAVKSDPRLKDIPVYNFTDYPQPPGDADYVNLHPYPKRGAQPFDYIKGDFAPDARPMPDKPKVITEAGYCALPNPDWWKGSAQWAPVDERTQAILTLNLLLDAFTLGARRTYLYQLLDAYPDPNYTGPDQHLGLFDLKYWPKPAADAIHNLTARLGDNAAAFPLRHPDYPIGNLPKTGHAMLLEKSDGTDVIVLWNEPPIWNAASAAPIRAVESRVALEVVHSRKLTVYDPIKDRSVSPKFTDSNHIEVDLAEDPLLVFIAE